MRTKGSPQELENRRRLAVQRVGEGRSPAEVAGFLGVHVRTVQGWVAAHRRAGDAGLAAKPQSGRPRKLAARQERTVLSWLSKSPLDFGFPTELWTAPRVAKLVKDRWGVKFHPRYLNEWLSARGITPQKPRAAARERDEAAIAAWRRRDWPRIKKRPGGSGPTSS